MNDEGTVDSGRPRGKGALPVGEMRRQARASTAAVEAARTPGAALPNTTLTLVQAAEVPGQQRVSPGGDDIRGLVAHHAYGDFGVFDAERAAEATAGLRFLHFCHFQPRHAAQ